MPARIEEELLELFEPLVRRVVREEVERAKLQWRWLSVRHAAEVLDLTPAAVHHRIRRGQLPSKLLDGRRYVDMKALDRQLDELQ